MGAPVVVAAASVIRPVHAVIVLGVLEVSLGGDTVAGGKRVARQGQVFLLHLLGRAADLDLGSVALDGLAASRRRMALAVTPGTRPSGIGTVFHGTRNGSLHSAPLSLRMAHTASAARTTKIRTKFGVSMEGAGGERRPKAWNPNGP